MKRRRPSVRAPPSPRMPGTTSTPLRRRSWTGQWTTIRKQSKDKLKRDEGDDEYKTLMKNLMVIKNGEHTLRKERWTKDLPMSRAAKARDRGAAATVGARKAYRTEKCHN